MVQEQDRKFDKEGRYVYDYALRNFKWQPPKRHAEADKPDDDAELSIEARIKKNTAALFLNRSLAKMVNEGVDDDWANKGQRR